MYKIYVDGNLFCDSRNDSLAIISPVVKLQANQAGSFTFTIPAEHPHYDAINRRTSIVSVYRDGSETPCFQGVCTEETVDFYKQKAIVCEGELTYLNDSILRQAHYSVVPVRTLLETYINEHNSQVDEAKRFLLGRVTVEGNATCYTNLNSTMTEIKEDLIDDFGGYIFVRYENGNKYIDYLAESPKTCNQTIELGKNLLDYSSNIDNTEIATSIIPLGAKLEEEEVEGLPAYVTIKSVNDGKDYVLNEDAVKTYGQITKVVNWDDVTEPSNLLRKGKAYLTDIQFENVTLSISAVDFGQISDKFDEFELLDTVRVVSATHGMDRTFVLTEQTLNLNNPENDTITLGTSEKLSMSARSNSQNSALLKRIEQAPTSSWITNAINNATALISGNKGGYVILHDSNGDGEPDEVLVMDTNDISTATKVWRWNKGGFGYSSTGYNGKYGTAITMDGQIVADYIKAGTISGVAINNGNGTFKVDSSGNLTASSATLSNGTLQCGDYNSRSGKFFKVFSTGDTYAQSMQLYSGLQVGGSGIGKYCFSANGTSNNIDLTVTDASGNELSSKSKGTLNIGSASYDVLVDSKESYFPVLSAFEYAYFRNTQTGDFEKPALAANNGHEITFVWTGTSLELKVDGTHIGQVNID